ncbi:MAG TPA: class D sortase [Xanthomonadales bacterium]|nr:class D sortase [Xanthomonadales bacterium]
MKLRATTQESMRVGAWAFICGIALLVLSPPANAQDGEQAQANPASAPAPTAASTPAPARTYFWIRDPWTKEKVLTSYAAPDQSLWDATQIRDYEAALKAKYPPPLGLLIIRDLNIEVPIYNGADEHILDRGAGRIKGMAKMNEDGNLGISAHRDSFFRGLKDIEMGDEVLVQSAHGVVKYAVSNIKIVPKDDISVLAPVETKTLTLVTCYPFYHVGAAPERMIVTALPVVNTLQ